MLSIFKKLIHKILNKKYNFYNTKKYNFEYCGDGFILEINKHSQYYKWDKISEINVFKRDLITIDIIEMEIIHEDKSIIITEDMDEWSSFIQKIKDNLPNIPQDWETEIIHPPFETNFRTIYTKL